MNLTSWLAIYVAIGALVALTASRAEKTTWIDVVIHISMVFLWPLLVVLIVMAWKDIVKAGRAGYEEGKRRQL